jgi:hypothetical protein
MPDDYALTDTVSDEFRTGALIYRVARQSDDATLRSILQQTPTRSWITLSTEYEPSYFSSSNLFGERLSVIAHQNDVASTPVGMCAYTGLPSHIDGNPEHACYLGELRVLSRFQKKPGIVKNGFRAVEKFAGPLTRKASWFTSIASDNLVARRLLEAGLKGMPVYRLEGELVTMALAVKSAQQLLEMQPAQTDDIPALADFYNRQARLFQYSPVLSEDWLAELDGSYGLQLQDFYLLKDAGKIQACFALWDQREMKQTVVRKYRFPLNLMRIPYNLFAGIEGRVKLPPVGSRIEYLFIAFLAVQQERRPELCAIVKTALDKAKRKQADIAMLGLSARHPQLGLLDELPRQVYRSCIESVSWYGRRSASESSPKTEIANIIQPEIALL